MYEAKDQLDVIACLKTAHCQEKQKYQVTPWHKALHNFLFQTPTSHGEERKSKGQFTTHWQTPTNGNRQFFLDFVVSVCLSVSVGIDWRLFSPIEHVQLAFVRCRHQSASVNLLKHYFKVVDFGFTVLKKEFLVFLPFFIMIDSM